MTKKNYLKLILTTTLLFFAAIFAAAKINATAPDVNFGYATALTWKGFSGEEDFWDLGTDEIEFWTSITGIADYTNATDTPEFVAYNGVNAIYTGHTESYIYWVFDGVLEEVHFYNYKFHKSETVAYANLVDVRSVDIEIPIVQHTVSFYNEDVLHANKVVMTNEVVELPEDPLKDGHHFVGWYYDPLLHYEFDPDVDITHDFNLYAKWQLDEIEVNFWNGSQFYEMRSVNYGDNLEVQPHFPFYSDYKEILYENDFTDSVLYEETNLLQTKGENWDYNIANTTGDFLYLRKDGFINNIIPFKTIKKLNITAQGYYKDRSYTSTLEIYGSIDKIQWDKIGYFSVYELSEKTRTSKSFNLTKDYKYIKLENKESGAGLRADYILVLNMELFYNPFLEDEKNYELENWYYDQELTQPYNENDVFLEDTNLYAGYKEVDNNIEFKVDNEVYHSFISNNFNIELPDDPVKVGYTFDGWYYDEEFLNAFDIETDITDDLTLYAKFILNENTITFNFESEVYATAIYDIENGVILPEVPETALEDEFLGWYYDELFENRFNTTDVIIEDITLYGKIETINFNIKFKVDDEIYESIIYLKGSDLILPATPTKEELVFLGWYYDEEFENKFSLEDEIVEDIILYGKFSSGSGGGSIDDSDETKFKTEYIGYAALVLVGLVVVIGLVKAPKKRKKR